MPRKYDLHTHSTASDGTLTPPELVALAAAKGVEVLALTDHDTLEGLASARTAADAAGLILSPGVEISVTWGGRTIHIIGLGIDLRNQALCAGLAELSAYRRRRAEAIGQRLAKEGIEGAFEGARAFSNGRLIGRTHFARFLVQRGYASDEREVFKHYLVKGKPGHVVGDWASLETAVGWIRGAGGQAVIAHPGRYHFTRAKLLRLIGEFTALGGVGIEVVSGSHTPDECLRFARYAQENRLLASVGSDFHGPGNPWTQLGGMAPLPSFCTPIWADWEEQRLSR
ncbi:PHP domain-containing protein [Candidatus Thiosymbion oneisti]|uniref:PHP domain-containing protein n=1 Tax=Candidatus Thiosymbion oneisti TaxID=589554 RepID=UPI000B24439B|nr:PHP domain-containing protein [Candidatus Thiosymbion oneisti]